MGNKKNNKSSDAAGVSRTKRAKQSSPTSSSSSEVFVDPLSSSQEVRVVKKKVKSRHVPEEIVKTKERSRSVPTRPKVNAGGRVEDGEKAKELTTPEPTALDGVIAALGDVSWLDGLAKALPSGSTEAAQLLERAHAYVNATSVLGAFVLESRKTMATLGNRIATLEEAVTKQWREPANLGQGEGGRKPPVPPKSNNSAKDGKKVNSYAKVVRARPPNTVLVSRKEGGESATPLDLKLELKSAFGREAPTVDFVRVGRDGVLKIACKSADDAEKLKELVRKKCSSINASSPKLLQPRIRLGGVLYSDKSEWGTVWEELGRRNPSLVERLKAAGELNENGELNAIMVVAVLKSRGSFDWILQLNPKAASIMTSQPRLYMDLVSVVVAPHVYVSSCKYCFSYGHKAETCPNKEKQVCGRCGGAHLRRDCEAAKPSCVVCARSGKPGAHDAQSMSCPERKKRVEGLKMTIESVR